MDELVALAKEVWPIIGGALMATLAWVKWRSEVGKLKLDAEQARNRQQSDLIKIAQDAARAVIEDLRAEVDRLQRQINELERELMEARREHSDTIAAKDAEIALLRGELRQWQSLAMAYEQKLEEAEIPHEKPRRPYFGVPAGDQPTEVVPL